MRKLLVVVLVLAATASATAAPEGFRLSQPLTDRAVRVGSNPVVTVHCARSQAIWVEAAITVESKDAVGRANMRTLEIMLPPSRCVPLERWLKGKRVNPEFLAEALFTLAHEMAHASAGIRDELEADCYATAKYSTVARAFGVKSSRTLTLLRERAPLLPPLELC